MKLNKGLLKLFYHRNLSIPSVWYGKCRLLAPSGGEYEEGTIVTITAIANEGYAFDHWEGDAEGSDATATLTMDSDKNAFACFKTTESQRPKVDTFVELTSQIETDQDGVKVFGQTNLPNSARLFSFESPHF